jgi:choline dehydrogenase-like flavoprotein
MPLAMGLQGNPYDAIIVGAGATGAWAAGRLGAAGMNVLLLDAGPNRPRISPWQARFDWYVESYAGRFRPGRKRREEKLRELARRQPIQSLCYAWAGDPEAFVDDIDNPYVATGAPFCWFRARQVGGRLAVRHHGRRFFRFTDGEFKAGGADGLELNWPVSHDELAPYYAIVERRFGMAPRECNRTERWLKSLVAGRWPGRELDPVSRTYPPDLVVQALSTGRVTLQSGAVVSHLELDLGSNEIKAVAVIDATTQECREIFGRKVFMCASTIESTRVLLNSRSARYPEGIGNASGVLGRYFMDQVHVFANVRVRRVKLNAWVPPRRIELFVPFPRETATESISVGGYGVQIEAGAPIVSREMQIGLSSFGEMLPRHENRITLSATTKDKWGLAAAEIECRLSENDRNVMEEQRHFLGRLRGADIEVDLEDSADKPLGYAIHEVGTARMGDDPKTSYLDPYNRSWEIRNLFVTDGSSFVTSGYQNPTLTMLALTERACDRVLKGDQR